MSFVLCKTIHLQSYMFRGIQVKYIIYTCKCFIYWWLQAINAKVVWTLLSPNTHAGTDRALSLAGWESTRRAVREGRNMQTAATTRARLRNDYRKSSLSEPVTQHVRPAVRARNTPGCASRKGGNGGRRPETRRHAKHLQRSTATTRPATAGGRRGPCGRVRGYKLIMKYKKSK